MKNIPPALRIGIRVYINIYIYIYRCWSQMFVRIHFSLQ